MIFSQGFEAVQWDGADIADRDRMAWRRAFVNALEQVLSRRAPNISFVRDPLLVSWPLVPYTGQEYFKMAQCRVKRHWSQPRQGVRAANGGGASRKPRFPA
jgi:hypothetical protein